MTWSRLLKALLVVVLLGGVVLTPYWFGHRGGIAAEKARCLDTATNDQAQAITALQAELQLAWQQLRDQQHQHTADEAKQRELEQQLATARAETRVVYRTIRKEIPHASLDVAPAPVPGGLVPAGAAGCDFGPGFVGLWDAASDPTRVAAGMSGTGDAAALAAAPAGGAGAAPAVDAEQLLANHIDNAELCTEARADLNALIDWHLEHDLVQRAP